jgi:DNA polymerase III delta subunit
VLCEKVNDFRSDVKTKQKYWILKIIELFGYKIENTVINNVKVSQEDFNNVKANVIKTINNELRILFGIGKFSNEDFVKSFDTLRKSNISSLKTDTNKKFLGWFNGLLKSWGLKVTKKDITIKNKRSNCYFIDSYVRNTIENNPQFTIYV